MSNFDGIHPLPEPPAPLDAVTELAQLVRLMIGHALNADTALIVELRGTIQRLQGELEKARKP